MYYLINYLFLFTNSNRLNELVLLSTESSCFDTDGKKSNHIFAHLYVCTEVIENCFIILTTGEQENVTQTALQHGFYITINST